MQEIQHQPTDEPRVDIPSTASRLVHMKWNVFLGTTLDLTMKNAQMHQIFCHTVAFILLLVFRPAR